MEDETKGYTALTLVGVPVSAIPGEISEDDVLKCSPATFWKIIQRLKAPPGTLLSLEDSPEICACGRMDQHEGGTDCEWPKYRTPFDPDNPPKTGVRGEGSFLNPRCGECGRELAVRSDQPYEVCESGYYVVKPRGDDAEPA